MTITLTPYVQGTLCHGNAWTIVNEDDLAQLVARLLLGQYRHVARIIAGAGGKAPASTSQTVGHIISLLTAAPGAATWHRDGLLFQAISWVAAHRAASAGALIRAPHLITAHKGFDGLQLELGGHGTELAAAIIFEDKATENPRSTITAKVWPELKTLEAGERQNELLQEATALLETVPGIDVDAVIETIAWKEVRRYRISVTVSGPDAPDPSALYKGFDDIVTGGVDRRCGEVLQLPELRSWMKGFSARVIGALQSLAAAHV